jgi:hypothetical protein
MTAAQLGLAGPGETVQSISYATWRGTATVISGTVTRDGSTYAAVWLSTDGGSAWTRVTVPADHGAAGTAISGLGFDASGLLASGPALCERRPRRYGLFFTERNGVAVRGHHRTRPRAGTPVVKGSDFGFVVAGASAAGQLVAFTSRRRRRDLAADRDPSAARGHASPWSARR